MPNIPLTLLLHFGILLAGVATMRLFGRHTAAGPLALGLGIVLVYWIVSPLGLWVQGKLPGLSDLHWNWLGKLFALMVALLYWQLSPLSRDDIGLTWRQRAGSLFPAIIVVVMACAVSWTDEAILADGTNLSSERLLFQSIMPGLDEEMVFRGLLLAFFTRAFGAGRKIAGARFGVAGLAATFLFAVGHGLFVVGSQIRMDWHALLVTGALGAIFLWLRARTGSLLAPFVAHNLSNFGNSFF